LGAFIALSRSTVTFALPTYTRGTTTSHTGRTIKTKPSSREKKNSGRWSGNGKCRYDRSGWGESKAKGIVVRTISSAAPAATSSRADRQYPHSPHSPPTAVIREVAEGSEHTQFDVFLLFLRILLRFAPLRRRRRRRVCADCIPLWHVFGLGASLGFVEGSENDIRGDVVDFGVSSATSPASPARGARLSWDGGDRYCCCLCLLVSSSGVAPRR